MCPAVDDPDNLKFFESQTDCGKYFVCFRGDLKEQQCVEGTWWHAEIESCDDPANVECVVSVVFVGIWDNFVEFTHMFLPFPHQADAAD